MESAAGHYSGMPMSVRKATLRCSPTRSSQSRVRRHTLADLCTTLCACCLRALSWRAQQDITAACPCPFAKRPFAARQPALRSLGCGVTRLLTSAPLSAPAACAPCHGERSRTLQRHAHVRSQSDPSLLANPLFAVSGAASRAC